MFATKTRKHQKIHTKCIWWDLVIWRFGGKNNFEMAYSGSDWLTVPNVTLSEVEGCYVHKAPRLPARTAGGRSA